MCLGKCVVCIRRRRITYIMSSICLCKRGGILVLLFSAWRKQRQKNFIIFQILKSEGESNVCLFIRKETYNLQMAYSVVKFPEDGSCSEIPSLWILPSQLECWWPRTKNVSQLIRKRAPPDSNTWRKCTIVVETSSVNFERARRKAEDLDYSTSEEACTSRRIPKANPKYVGSDEDESSKDSNHSTFAKDIPRPPSFEEIVHSSENSTENPTDLVTDIHSSLGSEVAIEEVPIHVCSTDIDTKLNKILEAILEVKEDLKYLKQEVKYKTEVSNSESNTFQPLVAILPIKNEEGVTALERFLDVEDNEVIFKKFVSMVGGKGPKDHITRVYKRTFSDEFGVHCSWLGQRSNFRVNNLKCIKLIQEIIYSVHALREKEFETTSSEWFRHSNQRLKRNKKVTTDLNTSNSEH